MDSSRPGNNKVIDGKELRRVIDEILNNKPISQNQIPSIGCNIKWK